jgi:hypothetical protein
MLCLGKALQFGRDLITEPDTRKMCLWQDAETYRRFC